MNAENVATDNADDERTAAMISEAARSARAERDEEEREGEACASRPSWVSGKLEIGLSWPKRDGCEPLPVGRVERAHRREKKEQPGAIGSR